MSHRRTSVFCPGGCNCRSYCCPCCYEEACHQFAATWGAVCFCIAFLLFIVGSSAPGAAELAGIAFFLLCPVSIIVGVSGYLCLYCCRDRESDIEDNRNIELVVPTALAREENILHGQVVPSGPSSQQPERLRPSAASNTETRFPVAIPVHYDSHPK